MAESRNFLDLLPEEDRKKTIDRANRHIERNRSRKNVDVPPEIYLVAKAGIYWGWPAMQAIRRGYTIDPVIDDRGNFVTDLHGRMKYEPSVLTLEEVDLMLEGADKVRYSQMVEGVHAGVVSNSFKSGASSFDGALKPFTDNAKVTE